MAENSWLDTIGVDPSIIVDQIVNKGASKYDAAKLVNNLIAVNLQQAPRRFTYAPDLPVPDSTGQPTFVRTFAHQDWVDGESVVQAGESADDRGFNWRFNALAADVDALHADTVRLFGALSSLRAALVTALQEVASELNRLDSDTAGLSTRTVPQTPWNWNIDTAPQFLGVRALDDAKVTMWKTANGVVVLPGVDTVGLQNTVTQRLSSGAQVLNFAAANPQFATDVAAGTTVDALIAKYGTQPTDDGRTVAQVLSVLPPTSTFTTQQTLVDGVNTQEQAFLRSTVGSVDAVGALTGVTSNGTALSAVSPSAIADSVSGAPAGLGSALVASGLTMQQVATTPPDQLVASLSAHGATMTTGQAAELQVRASMLNGLVIGQTG